MRTIDIAGRHPAADIDEYDRMKEQHLRDYPDQDSELAWEISQHLTDYHRFCIAPLQKELEEKKRTLALFS